mmetsp:Transcript_23605/g.34798  ORF Transcript_23605/g.34798 Transcript_23605/m.34798 type:complete len:306 (+) Transcript_23605:1321-2238(+)
MRGQPQQQRIAVLKHATFKKCEEGSKMEAVYGKDEQQIEIERRRFLISNVFASFGLVSTSTVRAEDESSIEEAPVTDIVRLSSGLQFVDQRVGSGPLLQLSNKSSMDDKEVKPDDPRIVLLHLRALRRDGSILLDTYKDNKPLLFQLGSVPTELYYINDASSLAKGIITLGVQDAILASGSAVVSSFQTGVKFTKAKADPMRTGGIRKVVVPPELAYGSRGVSRYEAFQLGLKQPVARDEILRYEIEILRCNDEVITLRGDDNDDDVDEEVVNDSRAKSTAPIARACCPEELYPCKMGRLSSNDT